MSRHTAERVAVVVASIDARATVVASLGRFRDELGEQGELVLVDASRDGTADVAERNDSGLRVIRRAPGTLAPELWHVGLSATGAPLVALSTAAMVPCLGWLTSLRQTMEECDAAAVGGPIEPASILSPFERAVYLHRYARYFRPVTNPDRAEPPGDNALYRRDRLRGLNALRGSGFWEVDVHRELRGRGERVALAPDAVVEFRGGEGRRSLLRQRFDHARRYGASRACEWRVIERALRIAACPAVPLILLARAFRSLDGGARRDLRWLSAVPDLTLLLGVWSVGEAVGIGEFVPSPRRNEGMGGRGSCRAAPEGSPGAWPSRDSSRRSSTPQVVVCAGAAKPASDHREMPSIRT